MPNLHLKQNLVAGWVVRIDGFYHRNNFDIPTTYLQVWDGSMKESSVGKIPDSKAIDYAFEKAKYNCNYKPEIECYFTSNWKEVGKGLF
jgi:hypothetical protein